MNILRILALIVIVFAAAAPAFSGQKVETVDGVRVVHNSGPGAWGRTPKVTLEPAGVLGDVDTADANLAFHIPMNIVLDAAGNRYVLDSGNHRLQKFGPDGRYLATFGRQGQGPGEFVYPSWLSLDDRGFLYVSDPNNNRVQVLTPEGKDHKTIRFTEGTGGDVFWTRPGELLMGLPRLRIRFSPDEANKGAELPKLLKVIDESAKVLREYCEPRDFKDDMVNIVVHGHEPELVREARGKGRKGHDVLLAAQETPTVPLFLLEDVAQDAPLLPAGVVPEPLQLFLDRPRHKGAGHDVRVGVQKHAAGQPVVPDPDDVAEPGVVPQVHAPLLDGAEDENKNPYAGTVTKLAAKGVEFRVWQITLERRKIDPKKLSEARLLRRQGGEALARAATPGAGTVVGRIGQKSLTFRPRPLAA